MDHNVRPSLERFPQISAAGRNVQLRVFSGADVVPWLGDLARLRIEVFREFPYLYDGVLEYERGYLEEYAHTPDCVLVLAQADDQVIGASSGLPLGVKEADLQRPFRQVGLDPNTYFYCAETVLAPAFRGQGLYRGFLEAREAHAHSLGRYEHACFCVVERAGDHPMRPAGHRDLDEVWKRHGYKRRDDLRATFPWKDIFEIEESPKPMVFWVKPLC